MNVKLLLDENVSPAVAEALAKDGIDAVHIRDRGLIGATDRGVLERAYNEDRILVTCNVDDFLKLARAREVHPGIVLIEDGNLQRDEQLDVVRNAVEILKKNNLVNRALRIWHDGTMLFEDIPAP